MKILIDLNLPPALARPLAAAGHEVCHWADVGALTAADREIMAWARDRGFVVATHDLDFGSILAATGGQGPSVVQVRAGGLAVESLAKVMIDALQAHGVALEAGALVSIDLRRNRVRLLPLMGRD